MKSKFCIVLCLFCLGQLFAQTTFSSKVFASAGQYKEVGAISVNYTIGETLVQTTTNGATTLTFGFNQPESITNAVVDINGKKIDINLSPNPVKDILHLSLSGNIDVPLTWTVSDVAGRQWAQTLTTVGQQAHDISLSNVPIGVYIVQAQLQNGALVQTFKVVKNE